MVGELHVSFENTEIAFKGKSKHDLRKAKWLFRSFDYPILLKYGPALASLGLKLGFKSLIKSTIFKQFCGGETISESETTVKELWSYKIGSIMDYSVEGANNEASFQETCGYILETIKTSAGREDIPFAVFKTTGIIHSELLRKKTEGEAFSATEQQAWENGVKRFDSLCASAHENNVRLFVDAEESWLQLAIDELTEEAMSKYNLEECIIYNTVQLYRHDRLAYLKRITENSKCKLGFKLVRGAYIEKERERAAVKGYTDPIQKNKASSDRDYNAAVDWCLQHADRISICIGTHNEESCRLAIKKMQELSIPKNDERVYFSQLLGMSDNISFNLSENGYRVAKYVPFGPIDSVIPYLTRRAQENSGVAGQMGRELQLINRELQRRNH